MIHGRVSARRGAVVRLRVRGPTGNDAEVDAVIDTGFSSWLTLPSATIAALGLIHRSVGRAVLADGLVRHFDYFSAELEWGGGWRSVFAVGNEVLLGMRLLTGNELRIAVIPGGEVEITPLP